MQLKVFFENIKILVGDQKITEYLNITMTDPQPKQ